MIFFVSGGAGFIGSALVRYLIKNTNHKVVNIDKLTYAGNLESLEDIIDSPNYFFEQYDICESKKIELLFEKYKPDSFIHLAAESHVDRSIHGPDDFIQTNINGTYTLLELSRIYWESLNKEKKKLFKFHHVSTDEVYGDLGKKEGSFSESSRYEPSSPYSASKAASDHLVYAWGRTYGLPIVITNTSNNYGPYQYPEKMIPITILNAIQGRNIPIYGDGTQIRDWIHVDDHVSGLLYVLENGELFQTYNIGSENTMTNLELVREICEILNTEIANKPNNIKDFNDLMNFVEDRPGHDLKYAIDNTKIKELGWKPQISFKIGLESTVKWYIKNPHWCHKVLAKKI